MEFSKEEKTYPRTMSEIEWDDTEHRFAGAKTKGGEEVVMLERRWVDGYPDLHVIMCVDLGGRVGTWIPGHITPTGRRFRLEPTDSPTEPVLRPARTYRDWDGDEWECIDGRWIMGPTHAERVAGRKNRPGLPSLPEEYGPYTRIEDANE